MRRDYFTLLELLVAIAVIAVLAGLTVGGARFAFHRSEEATIRSRLQQLEMALESYRRDWGYYPIKNGPIDFLMLPPPGDINQDRHWNTGEPAPYIDNLVRVDLDPDPNIQKFAPGAYLQSPSGAPVFYRFPGNHNPQKYDLSAPGVDEKLGTADDITNWKKP